jgi:hypothetical protein
VVDRIYFWSANQFPVEFCLDIVPIFCDIDDFCQRLLAAQYPQLATRSGSRKQRPPCLTLSEVMTIVVFFQVSQYRTFKHFYLDHMLGQRRGEFPTLPSYTRFVELIPLTLLPLCAYLQTRKGQATGPYHPTSLRIANEHLVFALYLKLIGGSPASIDGWCCPCFWRCSG